jgi:hypothetical protein
MSASHPDWRGTLFAQTALSRRSMGKQRARCIRALECIPITQRSEPRGAPERSRRLAPYATIWLIGGNQVPTNGRGEMDRQLQKLVETLRVLARANEPNRVVLIEKTIDQYLNDKAGIVRLSLERLSNAIDREEAEKRPIEDWSIARDYIHSRLRRLA